MSETLSETHFSAEHLRAIGMVTVEWSMLEHVMERAIWALAKLWPIQGGCFTTKLTTRPSISVLKSLGCAHFGENSAEYKRLLKLADAIGHMADDRNSIAHARWFLADISNGTIGKTNFSANKKFKSVTEQLTPEDIEATAKKIYETGLDLIYFLQTTGLDKEAWRQTP